MNIFSKFFSFLFPPECIGCGKEDFQICPECIAKIPGKLNEKSFDHQYFEKILVFTDYEQPLVEKAIKKLKFRFAKDVLNDLRPFLEKHFPRKIIPGKAVFVPVPLHFLRKNQRGFNQSELLAHIFAEISGNATAVFPLLKRSRHTPHQSHLHKDERRKNVREAFTVDPKVAAKIPPQTPLVLVDDVATTGFTLEECARALQVHGYQKIWGLVIAHGK